MHETCPAAPGPSPGSGRRLCLSTNNVREAPDIRSIAIDGNCGEQHEMLPRDQWARLSPPEAGQGASHHDRRCVAPACSSVLPWFAGLGRGIPGFGGLAIGGASRSRAGWRGLRQCGQREHGHEAGQERSRHSLTHGEFLHSFQVADERSRCRGGCSGAPNFSGRPPSLTQLRARVGGGHADQESPVGEAGAATRCNRAAPAP